MEHELFQSKLKHLVDGALLSKIIESSSTGEHPHRTAAMELVIERSVRDRRERMLAKSENTSRPDPTPQPQGGNIQQAQPPAAVRVPAPQLSSQSSNNSRANHLDGRQEPTAIKSEVSSSSGTLPKTTNSGGVAERLRAVVLTDPPPPEVLVELVCMSCGVKQRRGSLESGVDCSRCPKSSSVIRCVCCGTIRTQHRGKCAHCHGRFR